MQQKRRLINELKAELEYCRKKWALARAINNESEEQCRQMRKEFSLRKIQDQNSGESGYSDEHDDEDDKITKTERFDRNLIMFDRTTSPTFTERRRSESPIPQDINLSIFSRAQSEPPQNYERSINAKDIEVCDLVTDVIQSEEAATEFHHDINSQVEALIVQSPPMIHDYDKKNPPKVKANLSKSKKKKANSKAETAEEMYFRLMTVLSGENPTTSSAIEDDEFENIEEIALDPLPEVQLEEVQSEISDDFVHVDAIHEEPPIEPIIIEASTSIEPLVMEPSTSTSTTVNPEQEYLERREARLARLEAEAKEFYEKITRDKEKRLQLADKLTSVHQNFLEREKRRTQSEENDSSSSDDDENVDEQKKDQNDDGKS